ncbi:MAG: hypothetical protein K9W44_00605 [Candidatus Lokiarchaeota archaeon]|nr:hypothetical protein [Candidatus Harpocratesius repetitus]
MEKNTKLIRTLLYISIDSEIDTYISKLFSKIQEIIDFNSNNIQKNNHDINEIEENKYRILAQKYHFIDYKQIDSLSDIKNKDLLNSYKFNIIHRYISISIINKETKLDVNIFATKRIITQILESSVLKDIKNNDFIHADYIPISSIEENKKEKTYNNNYQKNIFIYSTESQKDIYNLKIEPWLRSEKESDENNKTKMGINLPELPEVYYNILNIISV